MCDVQSCFSCDRFFLTEPHNDHDAGYFCDMCMGLTDAAQEVVMLDARIVELLMQIDIQRDIINTLGEK